METINRRLIVVDDEPGVLDAYRVILNAPPASPPAILSSRQNIGHTTRGGANQDRPTENDNPRSLGSGVLTSPLFDVTYCASGEEVLEKLSEGLKIGRPYVGGFFDVKLGVGIDGIETIRRAQKLDPNILVCIVSAYQDRSLEEIAKILGEDFEGQWDFLMKPFNRMEILQKAKNLLSNWEWRRSRKSAA